MIERTRNAFKTEVRSWWGIPFANARRFGHPIIAAFDPGRPYDRKGVAPIQARGSDWLEADCGTGEDCLNLNIWAPERPANKSLPVVVYIFGGGFEFGANTQLTSKASGLAATGRVVSVSINYRLGALGFLKLSQYGGKLSEATNLGFRDVIAALGWVKQNITFFGGDPQNVTVIGHSAGAFQSLALLGAPSANGLYKRIGGFSGGPSRIVPGRWAEALADLFLTELGIANDPEGLVEMDTSLLITALQKVGPRDIGDRNGADNQTLGLVLENDQSGGVLLAHPMEVLAAGTHRNIDVLFSTATNEIGWWVVNDLDRFDPHTTDNVIAEVARWRIPISRAQSIVSTYDRGGRTPAEVRAAILTDWIYSLPAARGALAHAAAGGNAHLLMIGAADGAPAVHGTEMYALVGQEQPNRSSEQADRDTRIRDMVLDFATGEHTGLWPSVTSQPGSGGVGNLSHDPTDYYTDVINLFDGIPRP